MKTYVISNTNHKDRVTWTEGNGFFVDERVKKFIKNYEIADQSHNIYFKSDKDVFELRDELNSFCNNLYPFDIIEIRKEEDMRTPHLRRFFKK